MWPRTGSVCPCGVVLSPIAGPAFALGDRCWAAEWLSMHQAEHLDAASGGPLARVGISAGYGWCNYFEKCRFGRNYIGLHTYSAGNAIEVTAPFNNVNSPANDCEG